MAGRASISPSPSKGNHVIWRSSNDLSGSSLESVVYHDVSTSIDSLSGTNSKSQSHEPDTNPGAEAGDGPPDASKTKTRNFLLKHGMWSIGSEGHVNGLCQPCRFVHTHKGCTSGSDCVFCHLPHVPCSSHTGNRPSKEKRGKCKELLNSLHASHGLHLDEASDLLKQVASQSQYMQRILGSADSAPQEPDDAASSVKTRRVKLAFNLAQEIHCLETAASSSTAAPAAKSCAARRSDPEKRRQRNLVSL